MLFEMYETYSEKAAPDVYKGLPIVDRDDLMRALQDAAGYELAAMVGKYLDKVEQQASALVDDMYAEKKEKVEEARAAEKKLSEKEDELWELNNSLKNLKDEVWWMMHGKDENAEATYADMYTIYAEIDDLIKF